MIRQAAILCGGFGSRLGALAAKPPSPLLQVDGVPFLDVLLFELGRHRVKQVLLLADHTAHRILEYASTTPMKVRFGLEIEVSIEMRDARTGGALWHARDRLADWFFLLNGYSWFDINLLDLAHRALEASLTSAIAVRGLVDASHCGVVKINHDQITRSRERPGYPGSGLVAAHTPSNGPWSMSSVLAAHSNRTSSRGWPELDNCAGCQWTRAGLACSCAAGAFIAASASRRLA